MAKTVHDEPAGGVIPYIPASESLPEITLKALLLGAALAAIMAGANAYLGLKVGLTVSASIPAAVISMAVLKLFRRSNILENNIVQTAASAGESVAAGVIFTIPALILLRYWTEFEWLETMAIAACGGVLGVLFTIPLRRALIIEAGLKFPEGVATGEVLKAGTEGGKGVRMIGVAAVAAALVKLAQTGLKVLSSSASGSVTAGGAVFGIGADLSLALLAVGFIVGLNIAACAFAGGVISWLFGIPIYTALYGVPEGEAGYDAAFTIWSTKIRYMGVGAMVVGGVWALVSLVGPIRDGVASSVAAMRAARSGTAVDIPRTERDTPMNILLILAAAIALPLFLVFVFVIDTEHLPVSTGTYWLTILFALVFAYVAGFMFSSVAGYMAGLVGSSNNPISGVTIATILTVSLLLLAILGMEVDFSTDAARATAAAAMAILVGGVICCAAAIAGDNMQDLKAGQIVGATPYKQQIMQIVGTLAGAVAVAPILGLLFEAYGLGGVFPRPGMDPNEMLAAPQATLMSSVAQGVFARNLEWWMIGIGAAIAVAIIAFDRALEARGASFRAPVLAVAVGIYLPLELSTTIFVGGMVAYLAGRSIARQRPQMGEEAYHQAVVDSERRGLLFASGLITGEALLGIVLAVPFAAAQSTDVLRVMPEGFEAVATGLGLAALVLFTLWLYRIASRQRLAG